MFVSAFFSFLLYLMIFFRLRGNIVPKGWRLKFQRRKKFPSQTQTTDSTIIAVAKMMLLYPVSFLYDITVSPSIDDRVSSMSCRSHTLLWSYPSRSVDSRTGVGMKSPSQWRSSGAYPITHLIQIQTSDNSCSSDSVFLLSGKSVQRWQTVTFLKSAW